MRSHTTTSNKNAIVAPLLLVTLLFLSSSGRTLAFYNNGAATTFGGMAPTRQPLDRSTLYSRQRQRQSTVNTGNSLIRLWAVITEERTETNRSTRRRTSRDYDYNDDDVDDDDDDYNDLEYMMDNQASRAWDDPFHILLLGQTFEKPKVTIPYVAGSLEYVLTMPRTEATELSRFAKMEGLACLGTWPRDECLTLGRQLQVRDIECRVVPFCPGGQRGWQAKDSSSSSNAGGADKVNQGV
jgi:hypothetical protein